MLTTASHRHRRAGQACSPWDRLQPVSAPTGAASAEVHGRSRRPSSGRYSRLSTLDSRNRGFTLVELVIVMVIVAIAFFAVQPAIRRPLQANRERAGLRRVMGALVAAGGKAVGEGRLVRVTISPRAGTLWAEIQADPWTDRAAFTPLALLGRRETTLPDELGITRLEIGGGNEWQADEATIYFYPDGRTSGAQLVLEGATGQQFFVELLPATGRVRLQT